jgi:hypothetical protein
MKKTGYVKIASRLVTVARSCFLPRFSIKLDEYEKEFLRFDSWCGQHGRMGRGGHGLPRVSPGPAMPNALQAATSETFCFNKKEKIII